MGVILLYSKGVSFTEVQEGLKRRGRVHCLADAYAFVHGLELSP